MIAAVGRGEISSANVVKAVYPDHRDEKPVPRRAAGEEGWFGLKRGSGMKFRIPGISKKVDVESAEIPVSHENLFRHTLANLLGHYFWPSAASFFLS